MAPYAVSAVLFLPGAVLAFLVARHLAGERVARKAGGRLKQLI